MPELPSDDPAPLTEDERAALACDLSDVRRDYGWEGVTAKQHNIFEEGWRRGRDYATRAADAAKAKLLAEIPIKMQVPPGALIAAGGWSAPIDTLYELTAPAPRRDPLDVLLDELDEIEERRAELASDEAEAHANIARLLRERRQNPRVENDHA